MSTRTALKQRYRIGAAAAAIILPLALTGCGSDDDEPASSGGSTTGSTTGASPTESKGGSSSGDALGNIEKGFDKLSEAKSASFELSFTDGDGKLAAAMSEGSPEDKELIETVLGGKIKVVVDPAGDATLGSLGSFDSTKGLGSQLTAANFSLSVNADGGDIAGIRLVKGALYASVDLKKIDELATKAGSGGIFNDITDFTEGAPPQVAPAIKDVQAGKWLKLDLVPLAEQFGGLLEGLPKPSASASAAVDSAKLVESLKTAVLSNTTATGDDGEYDVEIKAKETLTALVGVLKSSGIPGVDMFDTADLQDVGPGALKGKVKIDGDSIKELTLDLESVNALLPTTDQAPGGLGDSTVTLTFDDGAEEVSAPDNVSAVDLNALLTSLIGQFAGALGGGSSSGTTTG